MSFGTHLCVEAKPDTHLSCLSTITLGGVQVAAEAWQSDGRPTVRQEHVSWGCHDDGVRYWTWRARQEVRLYQQVRLCLKIYYI